MLLDQGQAYAQRLEEAGVKVSYKCFDSLPHGFVAFASATPAAEAALREAEERLNDRLRAAGYA